MMFFPSSRLGAAQNWLTIQFFPYFVTPLGHETFGLEIADHLGPLGSGKCTVDMKKAFAIRFQKRHNLFAVIDLELGNEFAVKRGVAPGKKKAVRIVLA